MEDYAAKMLLKTDAALREYVTGHVQYREAAVLAALDELRRRGQPAPEEAALRPSLEAAAATQRAQEEAAEAKRYQETLAADPVALAATTPSLYSPVAIVLFSMTSTMVMGGVLMGINLFRLGQKRATLGLALFIVAYLYVGQKVLAWAMGQMGLSPLLGAMLFNLPATLVYVLWFWPRYVGSSTPYRSRSLLVPIVVYFLLVWGSLKIMPYLIRQQPKEMQQQWQKMMPQDK